jgi:hypothetical protein
MTIDRGQSSAATVTIRQKLPIGTDFPNPAGDG